ncbi:hypothetical protein FB550_10941 [Neobacillus bataviensis]|uniref:MGS-like domain-containing protein n=1 Tax=Neobacillus bataviensis TaxID=220685 RepID=A0A561D506_9BACI|nr:hypothetical protein FB550_10941 [Neobacillus bataviensis]
MIDQVEEDNGESTIILEKALYKGFIASGVSIRPRGSVLFTVADKDKAEATDLAKRFYNIGYHVLATAGTAATFKQVGIMGGMM